MRALGGHVVVALMSSWHRTGAGGWEIKFEGVKAGLLESLGAWASREGAIGGVFRHSSCTANAYFSRLN